QGVEIANSDNNPSALFNEDRRGDPAFYVVDQRGALSVAHRDPKKKQEVFSTTVTEKGYLSYKGKKWQLYVEQPSNVVLGPVKRLAIIISAIAIFLIFCSAVVILYFILRWIHPIGELTDATKAIAAGDLDKRV